MISLITEVFFTVYFCVHQVFNSAVELARYLFGEFIPKHKKLGKNEMSQAVERILPELMARISDTVSLNPLSPSSSTLSGVAALFLVYWTEIG